jgi:hypothetical protein
MVGWLMNNQLQIMWKEKFNFYFEVPSQYVPGSTEKNYENFSQDNQSWPRFSPGTPEVQIGGVAA